MASFFIDRPIFAWVIALFVLVIGGAGSGPFVARAIGFAIACAALSAASRLRRKP